MKQVALAASMLNFLVSMVLWSEFDSSSSEYQFTQEFTEANFFVSSPAVFSNLKLGIDGISLYFVLLTTFITPICILSNWDNIKHNLKSFLIAFLLLETLLVAVFTVCDLLLFYVFFESVLIPLFLIVGIWGGTKDASRIRAAFLLFLYTLFGSLFMLLAFLVIFYNIGSTDFQVVSLLTIFISMAIKTPLLPFHVWLPRAHAEAPLAGSVILAGLILKLATYGYMRILIQFLPDATAYFSPLVQTIAVVTLIYASLATLRQTDFKALVAYSSIGHMAVVVLGLFSNTIQGIDGAILLSIAHGVVSPALFILVGGVLYDRYHTRVIRYYRGVTAYMPVFSLLFFVFTIFNAAVPLSANWAGEMLCLTGAFLRNPIFAILGSTGIVLSAAYSIWLYNRIAFGGWSYYLNYTTDISRREFMVLIPLLIVAVVFGVFPNIVLDQVHASASTLIYS
ncbi:NADH:ubiquinone oxidoreductase subunit 4 (mitochondrion) [Erysiphe pulchra]|uniref:NADH:ubiquinone oxidoreductase subunit 4 (Mitochondrion) n=1 Tax=Erysiphe pulchra TaxID=225359 RepID=A0A2S4PIZ3_9PEZI|nr:NADH:ubiquinone oxidoreductase subunit 4 (mitochondrion) [Erysiphe pulchra]